MVSVDVFISHANVDKPLIKPIVEALLRDGFAVFIDRPEDAALGFSADEIEYWRDTRKRLEHLRPRSVVDYDKTLLEHVKKARTVLGCLHTPLQVGQHHFGDELFLGASDGKLMICRLGAKSSDEVLANRSGLINLSKAQVCDLREIAPIAQLLAGRGLEDGMSWPEPTDELQRRALEQYKFLRKELEDKLNGWKLGTLNSRTSEAMAPYAKPLRTKIERLIAHPAATSTLAEVFRDRGIEPLAQALEARRPGDFLDKAMNVVPTLILDAFAVALDKLDDQHATEADKQGLRDASQLWLPMIFVSPLMSLPSDAELVRRAFDGTHAEVVEVQVGSATMGEVLMAAAERKATEFKPRRNRGDAALGIRAITLGAEAGPEDGEAHDAAALIREIWEMKGLEVVVPKLKDRVRELLDREYGKRHSDSGVKTRIAHELKRERRRYYLIAEKPDTLPAQSHLRAVLRQVCEAVPGLVSIIIDPTRYDEEDALLLSVLDLIKIEGGKG